MNKNAVEYEYEEILSYKSGTQYLFDIPVKKGQRRRAVCRCGRCGKVTIMYIKEAKEGRCCSRECAGRVVSAQKEKYHVGDMLNDIGSILVKRLDNNFGLIKCGRCRRIYKGNISQVACKNLVCFICRGEISAQHRTKYKAGNIITSKNGDNFLFEEELEPIQDSSGHPRRVGVFHLLDSNLLPKRTFITRLDFIIRGSVTGKNFSKGARKIANILESLRIDFQKEYTFDNLKGQDEKHPLKFDFMIPLSDKIVLIEFDGEQHYRPVDFFGGQKSFEKLRQYDQIKNDYVAQLPNTFLYRIPYYEESKIDSYYIYNLLFERG